MLAWLKKTFLGDTRISLSWLFGVIAAVSILAEVALLGIYASRASGARTFVVVTLTAGAAGVVGMAAGFLFGLPRYNPLVTIQPSADGSAPTPQQIRTQAQNYLPSNNLEQVSDWLTKILIGAGLVQLAALGRWFSHLTGVIANGLVGAGTPVTTESRVLAGSILLFNLAMGFPIGYIITTLWYRRKLNNQPG